MGVSARVRVDRDDVVDEVAARGVKRGANLTAINANAMLLATHQRTIIDQDKALLTGQVATRVERRALALAAQAERNAAHFARLDAEKVMDYLERKERPVVWRDELGDAL